MGVIPDLLEQARDFAAQLDCFIGQAAVAIGTVRSTPHRDRQATMTATARLTA